MPTPLSTLSAGWMAMAASFGLGDSRFGAEGCWTGLRTLQAMLDDQRGRAPGYVLLRLHRDRDRAARLCRNGDQRASIVIIHQSLKDLRKYDRR